MGTMTLDQLQAIKDTVAEKKAAVDFTKIENNLGYYNGFILNIRARLRDVKDMSDFKEFRNEWQHSLAVLSLPSQLAAFHEYIAAAENYNTQLFQLSESGKLKGFLPEFYDRQICNILMDSTEVFKHPFNKEYLKNCLICEGTRKAIYTHLVAVTEPSEVKELMDTGEIRKETILSLPKAVTARELTLPSFSDMDAATMQKRYYHNLQQLYRYMELDLPTPIIHKAEKLKGVTFDGRDDKLRYIMGQLGSCDENNMTDYRDKLVLTAQRYTYEAKDGTKEPAVRVLATIPGDKSCKMLDIGNLDRDFAVRLGQYYEDADISIEVEALGVFETQDGNRREPFMRMQVMVGDKAVPIEKKQEITDLSEVEDAFSLDDLK